MEDDKIRVCDTSQYIPSATIKVSSSAWKGATYSTVSPARVTRMALPLACP